jgi:hypothetical protein
MALNSVGWSRITGVSAAAFLQLKSMSDLIYKYKKVLNIISITSKKQAQ